jgi:hypothetical protein
MLASITDFDIGFLDMKRDIVLRLLNFCKFNRKRKIKILVGLCDETYCWKSHYLFEEVKRDNFSFRVILKNGKIVFGKSDDDLLKICFKEDKTSFELYGNMKDNETVRGRRMDVVRVAFQMYSSMNIGNNFLRGCTSLTTLPIIPNTITSIGDYFLSYCSSLTTTPIIPNTVTSIGDYFLRGCTSLTRPPIIPNTVTSVGDNFLDGCVLLGE